MNAGESKSSFFRQGGWMVIATVGSGVFMTAVQTIAAKLEVGDFGVFNTMLNCIMLLGIPTGAIQTVLAQQTSAAVTDESERQLSRAVRGILLGTLGIWLVIGCFVGLRLDWIMATLKVPRASTIVFTLLTVLTALWLPVIKGVLQGRQHFFGMGFVAIIDGVGRFAAVVVVVLLLHGGATGAVCGAWLGQLGSLLLGLWLTRTVWLGVGEHFDWQPWFKTVAPLTLGAGSLLVLQAADVVFVQSVFPKAKAEYYIPAAKVGFALVQFTIPLALVMYSKIARSAAKLESSDALRLTFLTTAALGILAAVGATALPTLPLRILYATRPEFLVTKSLVPWFAWCMLAFALANVLVNSLLARGKFAIVPWLVVIVAGYCLALAGLREYLLSLDHLAAFKVLVQTITGFNVVLLAVGAWYTWRRG